MIGKCLEIFVYFGLGLHDFSMTWSDPYAPYIELVFWIRMTLANRNLFTATMITLSRLTTWNSSPKNLLCWATSKAHFFNKIFSSRTWNFRSKMKRKAFTVSCGRSSKGQYDTWPRPVVHRVPFSSRN
jgi:hypothetical protein